MARMVYNKLMKGLFSKKPIYLYLYSAGYSDNISWMHMYS